MRIVAGQFRFMHQRRGPTRPITGTRRTWLRGACRKAGYHSPAQSHTRQRGVASRSPPAASCPAGESPGTRMGLTRRAMFPRRAASLLPLVYSLWCAGAKPTTPEQLYIDFDGFFAPCEEQADRRLPGRPLGVIPFAGASAGLPSDRDTLSAMDTPRRREDVARRWLHSTSSAPESVADATSILVMVMSVAAVAARWFRRSAALGSEDARRALADLP